MSRRNRRAPGSTARDGYGHLHQKRRAALAPRVVAGLAVCSRCGENIQPHEPWHLDHRDDRKGYLGAAHARCNTVAGGCKARRLRQPQPNRWSRKWHDNPELGTAVPNHDGTVDVYQGDGQWHTEAIP